MKFFIEQVFIFKFDAYKINLVKYLNKYLMVEPYFSLCCENIKLIYNLLHSLYLLITGQCNKIITLVYICFVKIFKFSIFIKC